MFYSKLFAVNILIGILIAVASQAHAEVRIIQDADGGTQVEAGQVRVYSGSTARNVRRRTIWNRGRNRLAHPIVIPKLIIPPIDRFDTNIESDDDDTSSHSRQIIRGNGRTSNTQTTIIRGNNRTTTQSNY
jgi:hypothetical protein